MFPSALLTVDLKGKCFTTLLYKISILFFKQNEQISLCCNQCLVMQLNQQPELMRRERTRILFHGGSLLRKPTSHEWVGQSELLRFRLECGCAHQLCDEERLIDGLSDWLWGLSQPHPVPSVLTAVLERAESNCPSARGPNKTTDLNPRGHVPERPSLCAWIPHFSFVRERRRRQTEKWNRFGFFATFVVRFLTC